MVRHLFLLTFLACHFSNSFAQTDSTSALTVTIGQDSYFGFYVSTFSSYKWKRFVDVTVYSNLWANPAFGTISTGTDFWTEVGGGLDFSVGEGNVHINPMVGLTYGKVLSGGTKGVVGDGIVPSLIITANKSSLSFSAFSSWFKALRHEGAQTFDYLWSGASATYQVSPAIHLGILSEHFILSRATNEQPKNLYFWIGPLIQVDAAGAGLKVSGGYDAENGEFLKLNLVVPITKN